MGPTAIYQLFLLLKIRSRSLKNNKIYHFCHLKKVVIWHDEHIVKYFFPYCPLKVSSFFVEAGNFYIDMQRDIEPLALNP